MQQPEITSGAAWLAFRNKDYDQAADVWLTLMQQTEQPELQNLYRFNYTYVLLAQGQTVQVQAILQELYEMSGNPFFLHRMGAVARESGNLRQAKQDLLEQRQQLDLKDHCALSANAYELGLIALLEHQLEQADEWAHISLQHAQVAGDSLAECTAHRLLGDVMMAVQKQTEAKKHYRSAFLAHASSYPANSPDVLNQLTG